MLLNEAGADVLARYLATAPSDSPLAAGVRTAFAILIRYSPYINETSASRGLDPTLVEAIEAIAQPGELAELLAMDFGTHLSDTCFARLSSSVYSQTDDLAVLWKLGQAAYNRRLRYGKKYVAPEELARKLLLSLDSDHRVIGLKVLMASTCDRSARLRTATAFLHSAEASDVYTALFVLNTEFDGEDTTDCQADAPQVEVRAALQKLVALTEDEYVRNTAQRLIKRL
jgi:hypothetical protein